MTDYPFADLSLSQRLERAEAMGNSRFVDARARLLPSSGATWIEVAGARAMFDGPASPLTQTFGLGLFQPATAEDLDRIESFYAERGAPVFHEVSPLGDASLPPLLARRGYYPCEFTSVMYRPIPLARLKPCATGEEDAGHSVAHGFSRAILGDEDRDPTVADGFSRAILDDEDRDPTVAHGFSRAIAVRPIENGEEDLYASIAAEGWAEFGVGDFVRELGRVSASVERTRLFLAELDGRPIAAGALSISDGVAHLAGASTIPAGRQRGAQLALLDARLRYAAEQGCDIALMGAQPGSGSQRNAERHGFRIAYTRIKWQR